MNALFLGALVLAQVPDAISRGDRAESPAIRPKDSPSEATERVDWGATVWFDRGGEGDQRVFRRATECIVVPCVVTDDGAIRFNRMPERNLRVDFYLVHDRSVTRIDYFEKRTSKDYQTLERALQLRRNRAVWSLARRLEHGDLDTLYVSGVKRQYKLREGDVIVLEAYDEDDRSDVFTAYFRVHRHGLRLKLDFALVVPINAVRLPKPTPDWESGALGAAGTLQLRRNKDPEVDYSVLGNLWMSLHPTLFLGLTRRDFEAPDGDTQSDLFAGVGLTFFDFLFVGWGTNLFQSPHFSQPFVGVHLRNAVEYFSDVDRRSPERWDDYMEREKEREIVTP